MVIRDVRFGFGQSKIQPNSADLADSAEAWAKAAMAELL